MNPKSRVGIRKSCHFWLATVVTYVVFWGTLSMGMDQALVLVQDGLPRSRIVVGKDASPSAHFAAKELQTYIRKSTGAELPIAETLKEDDTVEIVVGNGSVAKGLGVTVAGLPRDGFKIKTVGRRLVILGKDDPEVDVEKRIVPLYYSSLNFEHATLFGVYEFLERFVGVRWYLPVEIGEVVPTHKTLSIPTTDLTDAPNKPGRFIHFSGADDRDDPMPDKVNGRYVGGFTPAFKGKEMEDFQRRRGLFFLRMRHQTTMVTGNHTMFRLISPERFGQTHPEFFALFANGKRGSNSEDPPHSHHCYSNEEMIKVLIDDAKAYFRGNPPASCGSWGGLGFETPWGKAFHIMQDDDYRPCFCEKCKAFRAANKEAGEGGLIWAAIIKVADAVRAEFPKCLISTCVYSPIRSPPAQGLPSNILLLGVAEQGPYAEFVPNALKLEEENVGMWAKTGGRARLAFLHYAMAAGWEGGTYYASNKAICGSIPRAYASCYKRYADVGQGTYMYLMCHRFAYDHLSIYTFYKYHWNPKRNIDDLLNEYYTLFYGPAAAPMGKFWEEVETQFRKVLSKVVETPLGPQAVMEDEQDQWENIYGRGVIDRWKGYFQEAGELAAKVKDPVYAQRITYMKRNVMDSIEEGLIRYEAMVNEANTIRLTVRRTATPPVIDGQLDDAAWKTAQPVSLVMMETLGKPKNATEIRALWDDQYLYLAIDCKEPELDQMKADETVNDRSMVWRNNGVEIFLDPTNKGRTFYQFLFNNKGTWADCHVYAKNMINFEWNSQFKGKVMERTDGYEVELAIPIASLGKDSLKAGEVWRANFIRKRVRKDQDMGQAEYQTWSPRIDLGTGFQRGAALGRLDFVK